MDELFFDMAFVGLLVWMGILFVAASMIQRKREQCSQKPTYYPLDMERFRFSASLMPPGVRTVLDCGAHDRTFVQMLGGRSCVTLDIDPFAHVDIHENITDTKLPAGQFDCVCALEVIEHLKPTDAAKALREMAWVSRRYLLISVPNMEFPLGRGRQQWFDAARLRAVIHREVPVHKIKVVGFGESFRLRQPYLAFGHRIIPGRKLSVFYKMALVHLWRHRSCALTHHWIFALVELKK